MDIRVSEPNPEQGFPTELFEELSEKFFNLRQHRMQQASQEDMLNFLGEDVIMSMMELLADIANYCDKQFIKLAILQTYLKGELDEKGVDSDNIGLKAFQRSSEAWKDSQS